MRLLLSFIFGLFACLLANPTNAQTSPIDKGVVLYSGSASFSSYGIGDEERGTELSFMPSIRYFTGQRLAFGADFGFSTVNNSDETTTVLQIGPSFSAFFGPMDSTVYPFISGRLFYENASAGRAHTSARTTVSGFGREISGGVAFMIGPHVAFTSSAFVQFTNVGVKSGWTESSVSGNMFGVRFGLSAFIY